MKSLAQQAHSLQQFSSTEECEDAAVVRVTQRTSINRLLDDFVDLFEKADKLRFLSSNALGFAGRLH